MQHSGPSRTARGAAAHRAAHQMLEGGRVFHDPLACVILGEDANLVADEAAADPSRRAMRLFVAVRSRFAEDALATAVGRGTRQAVVLGAGLDTFSLRNPHSGLRVFEVDHPSTQAWKRRRLAEAGLAPPPTLTFVPIDFEREILADRLGAAGFERDLSAFFLWLGVVPYLTREAIFSTLGFIASVPGAEVVFDYGEPPETYSSQRRAAYDARAARVDALGEPWLSHFDPGALDEDLRRLGFAELEDLGSSDIAVRYFGAPRGAPVGGGGHVIRARV